MLRSLEQRAKDNAYKAADLASEAAVQCALYATIHRSVSDERSKAAIQLSYVNLKVEQAVSRIEMSITTSNRMSAQARHHDNEASSFNRVSITEHTH